MENEGIEGERSVRWMVPWPGEEEVVGKRGGIEKGIYPLSCPKLKALFGDDE